MNNFTDYADPSILLIPQDVEGLVFKGYLILKDEEFRIDVCLQSHSTLKDARFDCDWKMRDMLRGYEDVLLKKLQQSSSLTEFLVELKTLLENLLSFANENDSSSFGDVDCLQEIWKQIKNVGWDRLVHTNKDFSVLKFIYKDAEEREHFLILEKKVELREYSCIVDLPVTFNPKNSKDLTATYENFSRVVGNCQLFWNALKDMNEHCWILEPESITYNCTYRRLALGKNSSIRIEINPLQPTTFPECRFLGPTHVIEPLKKNLNKNMALWDESNGLLGNLQNILEVTLPSKASFSKEEIRIECGICYSYRLEDEIPEKTCEDERCGQTFHASCLTEWLRSLPTCRQSFNVIFGECPYCNKKLTISLKGKT